MTIHLKPELEELIKQDIQRGAYLSIDEYVEHAVFMLHEQETWLADHRSEIGTKIEAGYAAAQRGELIDPRPVPLWKTENGHGCCPDFSFVHYFCSSFTR